MSEPIKDRQTDRQTFLSFISLVVLSLFFKVCWFSDLKCDFEHLKKTRFKASNINY
jgi:hypothetical protein